MKTIDNNFWELFTLINDIAEYDAPSIQTAVAMLIDISASKAEVTSLEVIDKITPIIKQVNTEMGAFRF